MKRPYEEMAAAEPAAPDPLAEDVGKLLALRTEADWLAALPGLFEAHCVDALAAWDDGKKHKHKLVHVAVCKGYADVLRALKQNGLCINVQRPSDQCTPMHLAMFYKKPGVISALHELEADLTLKNAFGEACDAKYAAFLASYQNIIWLDLEMTSGHYESSEPAQILEAAVVVTDKELAELGRGHWVLGGFSKEELEGLGDFHQRTFRDAAPGGSFPPLPDMPGNGLLSDILASKVTREQAEEGILKLLQDHCPERACPLAGFSVQCDREVLKVRMPRVYDYINHRIIDVSSFVGAMDRWLPELAKRWRAEQQAGSNYNHRALNDVEASICSMAWLRKHLLVQPEALAAEESIPDATAP